MALTREEAKETVNARQVLLELVKLLKSAPQNDNELKQATEIAYSLPEEEQRRADKAREDIKTNQEILGKIRSEQNDLDISTSELGEKSKENDDALKKIAEENIKLDKKSRSLNDQQSSLDDQKTALILRENDLLAALKKLASDQQDLTKQKAETENLMDSLKEKAEQLRGLTQGL